MNIFSNIKNGNVFSSLTEKSSFLVQYAVGSFLWKWVDGKKDNREHLFFTKNVFISIMIHIFQSSVSLEWKILFQSALSETKLVPLMILYSFHLQYMLCKQIIFFTTIKRREKFLFSFYLFWNLENCGLIYLLKIIKILV